MYSGSLLFQLRPYTVFSVRASYPRRASRPPQSPLRLQITDADIERYLKEEGIQNVPTDVASRRRYKVALVWHIAIDLDIALMTQFHRATPGREDQEPDQDMVYWSFEVPSGRLAWQEFRLWR